MTTRSYDEGIPYPMETLRHTYVSPLGGRSNELGEAQVGVRREALEQNTSLDPSEDRVTLTVLGTSTGKPLVLQDYFEVVPLDDARPEALECSPRGELVLAAGEWDFVRRPQLEVPHGTMIQMKAAATRLLGPAPKQRLMEIVMEEIRRRKET
jgi:hypothetical protein